ncbi:putative competence protein [Mycobacterium kansasii 732]|nr:putative competence protein [Mycobacterium kansasii 732]
MHLLHGPGDPAAGAAARLDVRLVPAALTSWMVTAAGIGWPVGRACGTCCLVLAIGSAALWWHAARRLSCPPRVGAISAALVAIGVVGAGYGFAVAIRADSVARHPISAAFGTSVPVTVTPSESVLSLGAAD